MIHLKTKLYLFIIIISGVSIFSACNSCNQEKQKQNQDTVQQIEVPPFNADSAYTFIKKQIDFGPRVPNSKASKQCAIFLENKLKQFGLETIIQFAKVKAYNGDMLEMRNIIGSYKPELKNRIMLSSHWDSRPVADHDPDVANHKKPIPGANDGASGVGVLLEIARQIQIKNPTIGVDIIFWDTEDNGAPQGEHSLIEDDWCLGAQYWAKNPHVPNYFAKYGILLDMVGAADAKFYMEQISMQYAPDVVRKVWRTAYDLGFSNYFINMESSPITDDHLYINKIAGIPTIDIIHRDDMSKTGFYKYWHTINDDMNAIDKTTLNVVGQTLLTVIYNEN